MGLRSVVFIWIWLFILGVVRLMRRVRRLRLWVLIWRLVTVSLNWFSHVIRRIVLVLRLLIGLFRLLILLFSMLS